MRGPILLTFAFGVLSGVVSAQELPSGQSWTAMTTTSFAYCLASSHCDPGGSGCIDEEHSDGGCTSFCSEEGNRCAPGATASTFVWSVSGRVSLNIPDVPPSTSLAASGEPVSETEFVVTGGFGSFGFPGIAQLAVLRYAGDVTGILGQGIRDVSDLIDAGLIQPDDVLLVEEFSGSGDDQSFLDFEFTVDTTGVPVDEILLFATGSNPTEVPALSGYGFAVLILSVLVASAWLIRRRTGQRARPHLAD
jgi:hypothetical protein